MSSSVKIRLMGPGEENVVSNLVTSTFQHDVAPLYTPEGVHEFLSYASPTALKGPADEKPPGNCCLAKRIRGWFS